jgi:hypothetical protein
MALGWMDRMGGFGVTQRAQGARLAFDFASSMVTAATFTRPIPVRGIKKRGGMYFITLSFAIIAIKRGKTRENKLRKRELRVLKDNRKRVTSNDDTFSISPLLPPSTRSFPT